MGGSGRCFKTQSVVPWETQTVAPNIFKLGHWGLTDSTMIGPDPIRFRFVIITVPFLGQFYNNN